MITTMIQILFIKYKQSLLITLKKTFQLWIRFSDGCAEQYKNRENFINLCHHQQDFKIDPEWILFATSHGNSPCDGVGEFVQRYVAKRCLQRLPYDQILSYQSMPDLFVSKILSITFFGVSQEEMVNVHVDLG